MGEFDGGLSVFIAAFVGATCFSFGFLAGVVVGVRAGEQKSNRGGSK